MRVLDMKKSAYNLENLMDKHDMSVKDLHGYLGCSTKAIYKWLNAECMPSLDSLVSLTEHLHCTIDEIIAYKDVA